MAEPAQRGFHAHSAVVSLPPRFPLSSVSSRAGSPASLTLRKQTLLRSTGRREEAGSEGAPQVWHLRCSPGRGERGSHATDMAQQGHVLHRACCYTQALSVPFSKRNLSLREGELPNVSESSAKRQRIPIGVLSPEVHYTPPTLKSLYMSAAGTG